MLEPHMHGDLLRLLKHLAGVGTAVLSDIIPAPTPSDTIHAVFSPEGFPLWAVVHCLQGIVQRGQSPRVTGGGFVDLLKANVK